MKINPEDRMRLLEEFKVCPTDLLAVGTEAEVYSLDQMHVFKIYSGAERLTNIYQLREFYELVDADACGLKVPRIIEIWEYSSLIGVIELRLPGRPLDERLSSLDSESEARMIDLYLSTACALRMLKMRSPPTHYKLFDKSGSSACSQQRWQEFYWRLISQKAEQTDGLLRRRVSGLPHKLRILQETIRYQFDGEISVVHGDIYPGNILISDDLSHATGLVDFGSFTMFGDHLIDVASAVGFYRMYDPNRKVIRNRLLDRVETLLNSQEISRLYCYLAAQAIITCDLYLSPADEPDPFDNGHLCWAVEILEDTRIWENLE